MAVDYQLSMLEAAILAAIRSLGPGAYGLAIRRHLRSAGRDLSIGALYVALDGLEERDILRSQTGEGGPERGGRARRYYYLGPNAREG